MPWAADSHLIALVVRMHLGGSMTTPFLIVGLARRVLKNSPIQSNYCSV